MPTDARASTALVLRTKPAHSMPAAATTARRRPLRSVTSLLTSCCPSCSSILLTILTGLRSIRTRRPIGCRRSRITTQAFEFGHQSLHRVIGRNTRQLEAQSSGDCGRRRTDRHSEWGPGRAECATPALDRRSAGEQHRIGIEPGVVRGCSRHRPVGGDGGHAMPCQPQRLGERWGSDVGLGDQDALVRRRFGDESFGQGLGALHVRHQVDAATALVRQYLRRRRSHRSEADSGGRSRCCADTFSTRCRRDDQPVVVVQIGQCVAQFAGTVGRARPPRSVARARRAHLAGQASLRARRAVPE